MLYPTVSAEKVLKVLRAFLKEKPVQFWDAEDPAPPTTDAWLTTVALHHLGYMGKTSQVPITRETQRLAHYDGVACVASSLLFGFFKEEGRYLYRTPFARIVDGGVTADAVDEMIKNAYPDCIIGVDDNASRTDILVSKGWPRYLAARCTAAYLRDVRFAQSLQSLEKKSTAKDVALAELKKQEEEIAAMKAVFAAFAKEHLGTKESARAVLVEVGIIREDGSLAEAYGGYPSP